MAQKDGKKFQRQPDKDPRIEEAIREAALITMKGRRLGAMYFNIKDVETNPEQFAAVLARISFMPLRVECRLDMNQLEVIGLSNKFKRIGPNEQTPCYTLKISPDGQNITASEITQADVERARDKQ
jgi:hypothetical protein